ncbi:MAG: proton-conducting transporter membrane subunit [Candidatus Kapaibacteriota bacterium]
MFRVKRFKRMLAFSSMEHMALVIISLTLGKLGVYAAILHIVLHTLTKTGLFLQFGQIRSLFNSGWFKDTGGYMKYNPFSALVYILGLITITAIPPSGMFVSEFLFFKALLEYKLYFIFIFIVFLLTIIIYNMFHYSIPFLFDKEPLDFKFNKSNINNFEPISQLVLFSLVFYFA